MGCCCSNDSESETLEKSVGAKHDESYENPLMYDRKRPPTYGATSATEYDERRSLTADEESSPTTKPDENAIHELQRKKVKTTSKKWKQKLKGGQKLLKKKDNKYQSKETSENQVYQSKKKPTLLSYQDITTIREKEKQKRAQIRTKDLEAKKAKEGMSEALQNAHERGEKLDKLQDKTADLRAHSESFAENARKILEQEEQKHLAKKTKQHNT
ncbi:stress response protein nst1-like [Anneissia japonica]|uniref:stress response protein nst1-like n=1 Tax=Anneissia japonica TaxID=1529436 RepID=UPI0014257D62|nr:stress response protein nst1-like [Anneissia japonica]